jgi:hypothetical protein
MSIWEDNHVEATVLDVLSAVPTRNESHHFGRPYITAYQLAIGVHGRDPQLAATLNVPLGGAGAGQQSSLTQYLARELSQRAKIDPAYPVEGAFVSNENVLDMVFQAPDGNAFHSSAQEGGWDLSLFRLRD